MVHSGVLKDTIKEELTVIAKLEAYYIDSTTGETIGLTGTFEISIIFTPIITVKEQVDEEVTPDEKD